MIELNLAMAERALRAAQDKAKALGTPMTVTVVDEAGRLVLCARGDGTGFLTPDTSRAKAVAAAAFRRASGELGKMIGEGSPFWTLMPTVVRGEALPTNGGVPIVRGGHVIGGIGCGGGTGEQDHECAVAGATAVAS
jgi:glc operon protein GlcG